MKYRERLEEILNGEITLPKVPLVEKVMSLDPNRTVVVYGAGYWGREVVKFLDNIRPVSFFTDQNPKHHGRFIVGAEVLSPADVSNRCPDVPFVIVSPQIADRPEVMRAIQKNLDLIQGLTNEDVYVFRVSEDFRYGRYPAVKYWNKHKEDVLRVFDMFKEDASKEIFTEWMRAAFERDKYNGRIEKTGYFHDDLFTFLPDEVIIDCGAFTGDTITEAVEFFGEKGIGHIYSFEPDPENYKGLLATVSLLPNMQDKVTCFEAAVSDSEETLRLSGSGTGGSCVFEDGSIEIKAYVLDNLFLPAQEIQRPLPTLIKMDIEGSELSALRGAEKLIREAEPVLAICVYHEVEDILEIPSWINERCPSYDFYLRKSNEEFPYVDYVLIAVPQGRMKLI